MTVMEATVTIARPLEEVFRFFLDIDKNVPKADPDVESVVKTPEGPTRPGTTFHFRQKTLGKMRETTTTFISLEPNRQIEMEARVGPLRPKGTVTFNQVTGGTRVVVRLKPNPVGPLKIFSQVFAGIGRKAWDQRLARIKAAMESSPRNGAVHTN